MNKILKILIVIPAFVGFIFVPILAIASQWGHLSSPTQSLYSKIIVTYSCIMMYLVYPWIYKRLKISKEKRTDEIRGE